MTFIEKNKRSIMVLFGAGFIFGAGYVNGGVILASNIYKDVIQNSLIQATNLYIHETSKIKENQKTTEDKSDELWQRKIFNPNDYVGIQRRSLYASQTNEKEEAVVDIQERLLRLEQDLTSLRTGGIENQHIILGLINSPKKN